MLSLLIRIPMTMAHRLRLLAWRWRRSPRLGLHAVPVTPAGRIVLVQLTYAPGWHVPGGGWNGREAHEAGALRELREEIGLLGWSRVTVVADDHRDALPGPHRLVLFLVEGVRYRPRWSLEIAAVAEFAPDALPADLSGPAAAMLRLARDRVGERFAAP